MDIDKIAEAAAKMRRPVLRLNPEDYRRLPFATEPSAAEVLVATHGLAVTSDESVEPGHMWLVDAAPDPVPPLLVTPPIERDAIEAMDQVRDRWTTIGMDFGYGPSMAVVATFEDGRCVSVRYIRRPWKLTGRAATRARWRRRGRGR